MKKPALLIITLLSLLQPIMAYQQNNQVSNWRRQVNKTKDPNKQVKLYEELAWYFQQTLKNYDSAIFYANKGLAVPGVTSSIKTRSSLWIRICQSAYRLGNFHEAINAADSSIVISKSIKDFYGVGRAFRMKGHIFKQQKVYDSAITYYYEALESYNKGGFYISEMRCFDDLVDVYTDINRPDIAIGLIKSAILIAKTNKLYKQLAEQYINHAKILREKLDQPRQAFDRLLEAKEALNLGLVDTAYLNIINYNLIVSYLDLKVKEGSFDKLDVDSLIESNIGFKEDAELYEVIGKIAYINKEYHVALEAYMNGLSLAEHNKDLDSKLNASLNIAIISIAINDLDLGRKNALLVDSLLYNIQDPVTKDNILSSLVWL